MIKTCETNLGALQIGGREYMAAQLQPLATRWVSAPKTVDVATGDTLRIVVDFYYRGPAFSGQLYGAIGQRWLGSDVFDEILNSQVALTIPQCTAITRITGKAVTVPITSAISAGTYAIYAKIVNGIGVILDQTLTSYYENAVRVVGVTPEFSQFVIDDYVKV